jgi:hypothetical protein
MEGKSTTMEPAAMAGGAGSGFVPIGGRNPNPRFRDGAVGGRGVWFVGSGGFGFKTVQNGRGLEACGRGWFLKTGGVTLITGP